MPGVRIDPVALALAAAAALYLAGLRRLRSSATATPFPRYRVACFMGGLASIAVVLEGPLDALALQRFSAHMVQHMVLMMVAPPLLLLGTPVTLALRACSSDVRRRYLLPVLHSRTTRILSNPLVGWFAFLIVLWGSHFSSLYEATLTDNGLHALEHGAYLAAGLLFWWPVVGLGPGPSRLSHGGRILYLFLAMPQMAFLGLAIYSSSSVLYPYYTRALGVAAATADQHLAGAIMWDLGMVFMLPALALVLMDWFRREERAGERRDERSDEARTARL